jgi:hypothetical protein
MFVSRAVLGDVAYYDKRANLYFGLAEEIEELKGLVKQCTEDLSKHTLLADREKANQTYREFVLFDSHQCYPEFLVWYTCDIPSRGEYVRKLT